MTTTRPRSPANHQQKWTLAHTFPSGATNATGTVVTDTNANMTDGDKVVLSDGVRFVTYEYDKAANGVTAGNILWAVGTTAATVATNLRTAIVANQPAFTVVDSGTGTLTLTNNWPGTGANVAITKTSASALAVTGMAGGGASGSTLADNTVKLWKVKGRSLRVDRVHLNLPLGLVADVSNFCNFKVLKGASTVMASFSTQTSAQGTITADTPVELVLSATVANRFLGDGDVLSLFLDLTGTATVPPGRIVIEGYEL